MGGIFRISIKCFTSYGHIPTVDRKSWRPHSIIIVFQLRPVVCLTHWGRVTHICVGKLTIIGSENGLSPGRRQGIIWTNAGILLIGHLGTNFSEILIEIHAFSCKKIDLKMSSGKWRPSCIGLNVSNALQGTRCTFVVIRQPLRDPPLSLLVLLLRYPGECR